VPSEALRRCAVIRPMIMGHWLTIGWHHDSTPFVADRFALEARAYESFASLMQAGKECRALFDAARVPLPEPLRRFLGEGQIAEKSGESRVVVPPPELPPRPTDWQADWIWVPTSQMTPTNVVRGILRASVVPMRPREILERLSAHAVACNPGSLANIGTRLDKDETISRNDGAWSLLKRDRCAVLHEGNAWGEPLVFDAHELAAHRRLGILHVLKVHADGLQVVQLTRALESCDWLRAPVSKDLVKMDLLELQKAQKARRMAGHSGKWRAIE
jgi:hypothetical protein